MMKSIRVIGLGRRMARTSVVALLGVGSMLGGCSQNNAKQNQDALAAENAELRDKLTQAEQALQAAEGQIASGRGTDAGAGTGSVDNPFGDGTSLTMRGSDAVVTVAGDVLFDSGKTTLKSSAKSTLNQIASVIQSQYGANMVRVEGYADSDPIKKSKWEDNEQLSGERARAVEKYLVSRGVPHDRIYYAGFGPTNQKSSKAQSRRVEIVILGGA